MAELPLADGIPRFKANEDRFDRFTNGTDTQFITHSNGETSPTIRKFLKDKNDQIDGATTTIYEARDQAVDARDQAVDARDDVVLGLNAKANKEAPTFTKTAVATGGGSISLERSTGSDLNGDLKFQLISDNADNDFLCIFENGGTSRGLKVKINALLAGVASELLTDTTFGLNPTVKASIFDYIRDISVNIDLMRFVTDPDASDWAPYFNAAIDWVSANLPYSGATIVLPKGKQIPLSSVNTITSNNVYIQGSGKYTLMSDMDGQIRALAGTTNLFTWSGTLGGGLRRITIEGSRRSGGSIAYCYNTSGWQFEENYVRKPYNGVHILGGADPYFINSHIGGFVGNWGIRVQGTDPAAGGVRGDRANFIGHNIVNGWSNDGINSIAIGPAFWIDGYWHSVYAQILESVTANEGLKVASDFSDNEKQPQFILIDKLVIDYPLNKALNFTHGEQLYIKQAYFSGNRNGDLIQFAVNAADLKISQGKLGYAKNRVGTFAGIGASVIDCTIHRWDQALTGEPAFYLENSANDVNFSLNTAGRTGKLASGGSEAGKRFVAVGGSANSYLCNANTFIGLASTANEGTPIGTNRSRS